MKPQTNDKKSKALTLQWQKDIITQLKEGEKGAVTCCKYCVDKATISRIRKDVSKILEASEEQQDQKR